MTLLGILTAHRPNKVFASIVLGAIAGLCYAFLIPLLQLGLDYDLSEIYNKQTQFEILGIQLWHVPVAMTFFIVCLIILSSRTVSQVLLVRASIDVVETLRMDIYRRVLATGTRNLEKVGPSRVLSVINLDISRVITGAKLFPDVVISVISILGMLFFIWLISSITFRYVVLFVVLGALTYHFVVKYAVSYLYSARKDYDSIQDSVRKLLYGAKDLKLDSKKLEDFIQSDLQYYENKMKASEKKGMTIYRVGMNYGDLIGFFVIGFIVYSIAISAPLDNREAASVVMMLLYITAPIALLLNYIPHITQAKISLDQIKRLSKELEPEKSFPIDHSITWSKVEFQNVTFDYEENSDKDSSFAIGPISFEVNKSEIVFLVGGNGSGKSTVGKLLSLHYLPESGTINFDDVIITEENIGSYRQTISTIFSDFFLFEKLFGDSGKKTELIKSLLFKMDLDKKVSWANGRFSNLNLSQGQRKRLALIVAFLEDKDLYVFDEWAADQDPEFKEVFYTEILPEMRKQNKAVIVISHDDKYFHVADRLIKLESGLINSESSYHRVASSEGILNR